MFAGCFYSRRGWDSKPFRQSQSACVYCVSRFRDNFLTTNLFFYYFFDLLDITLYFIQMQVLYHVLLIKDNHFCAV